VAGVAGAIGACKYGTQFFLLRDAPEHEGAIPADWTESKVRSYRPYGNTGFEMSDISFGCSGLSDPAVARRAVERGINYFDTSPDYSNASSEKALGEGLRDVPRDQVFIASKFCTPNGHLDKDTPTDEIVRSVEDSLKRIGTDYLDVVLIHAVNDVDRLMAPTFHEAFDRLKQAGKVRFMGVSSHTPDLETVMRTAVDSGRFDMIMVAYNFANWPKLPAIFADAHQRGVATVAMKTLKGAYHTQLSEFTPTERESFAQAAFKWVLSNQNMSGLVVTMKNLEQIDEYLEASGKPLTGDDVALLERYDELTRDVYCRPGCGECLDSCPYDVPIDDILRYQMYARSYGQEKVAMTDYARVPEERNASHCASCPAPCEAACPYDIPIRTRLSQAHRELTLG
jgi:predicted aldo/keto reductase-like oxidoreductase